MTVGAAAGTYLVPAGGTISCIYGSGTVTYVTTATGIAPPTGYPYSDPIFQNFNVQQYLTVPGVNAVQAGGDGYLIMAAELPDGRAYDVSFDIGAPRQQPLPPATPHAEPDRVESRLSAIEHRLATVEGALSTLLAGKA